MRIKHFEGQPEEKTPLKTRVWWWFGYHGLFQIDWALKYLWQNHMTIMAERSFNSGAIFCGNYFCTYQLTPTEQTFEKCPSCRKPIQKYL
jgi:hypothetical protein